VKPLQHFASRATVENAKELSAVHVFERGVVVEEARGGMLGVNEVRVVQSGVAEVVAESCDELPEPFSRPKQVLRADKQLEAPHCVQHIGAVKGVVVARTAPSTLRRLGEVAVDHLLYEGAEDSLRHFEPIDEARRLKDGTHCVCEVREG
jgi:hypothetical protein